MARERYTPKPLSCRPAEMFPSAEAAWLWFWQCQLSRESGARVVADQGMVGRPCDPDDIYRVAVVCHRRGTLSRLALTVMARHGRALLPPDSRLQDEEEDARLWGAGMAVLEAALVAKGVVVKPCRMSALTISGGGLLHGR